MPSGLHQTCIVSTTRCRRAPACSNGRRNASSFRRRADADGSTLAKAERPIGFESRPRKGELSSMIAARRVAIGTTDCDRNRRRMPVGLHPLNVAGSSPAVPRTRRVAQSAEHRKLFHGTLSQASSGSGCDASKAASVPWPRMRMGLQVVILQVAGSNPAGSACARGAVAQSGRAGVSSMIVEAAFER